MQKPMEDLFDAFIYFGPQDLRLKEQVPADIALDIDYRMEQRRREALPKPPGSATEAFKKSDQEIVKSAENPFYVIPKEMTKDVMKNVIQSCLDRKNSSSAPQ